MATVVKTRGVIGADGHIVAEVMPFAEGAAVEIAMWPTKEGTTRGAETVVELRELARYLKEKYPDAPLLSDEAISRESIYADDGL